MGRGLALTEYQKGRIDALASEKYGYLAVANKIGTSKTAVYNYLNLRKCNGVQARIGRPPLLSDRETSARQLCYAARNDREKGRCTNRRACFGSDCPTDAATSTWNYLREPKVHPSLTKRIVGLRLQWADDMLAKSEALTDGIAYYLRDKRLPPSFFSKRAQGGGG